MKEITRINHIGLRVKDLRTSRQFYEKLGFKFIVGPVGPEPVAIMEHPSGVNINFILNSTDETPSNVLMDIPDKHTGYTHIALEITNTNAVEEQLLSHGIAITEKVEFEGAKFFFIRDPDENVIEFHNLPNNCVNSVKNEFCCTISPFCFGSLSGHQQSVTGF